MRRPPLLAVAVTNLAMCATVLAGPAVSATAEQIMGSQPSTMTSVIAATPAPGQVCVDILRREVGSDGSSLRVGSACSSSIQVARTLAIQQANRTQSNIHRAGETAPRAITLASATLLMSLYIDYRLVQLQREVYGSQGTCDGASYTFSAFAGDIKRISSARGWGRCNAVRLRNDGVLAPVQNAFLWM